MPRARTAPLAGAISGSVIILSTAPLLTLRLHTAPAPESAIRSVSPPLGCRAVIPLSVKAWGKSAIFVATVGAPPAVKPAMFSFHTE